jgi:hypothetical protein
MIQPYVKFLCVEKILCCGISGNAFIDYFQMSKTISRRCLSRLTRGIVCCSTLANIYLRKPMKSDAIKIVALYGWVHNIPGMMVFYVTKVTGKKSNWMEGPDPKVMKSFQE